MINAIVVDDEWYNVEEICDLLKETGIFHDPKKYQNPMKALEEAVLLLPEVAFVDIEMPEIDGITLAQRLQDIKPDMIIVFVTSWNHYAVQAFDINALDYILKPINPVRFHKMIDKVKNELYRLREDLGKELRITCFGELEAWIENVPVKWERSKAEELFAFLLMNHNNFVSKEIIIENLWPEYETQKALQILQTSVCRVRNIFSGLDDKVVIRYNQSKYCLTISDTHCDLFEVEGIIQSYKELEGMDFDKLEHAIDLCKRGFLSKQGYLWSMEKDEEIRQELVSILKTLLKKQQNEKNGTKRVRYLKLLADMLPYEDSVNYQLLQIYKRNGYEFEALNHFHWLKKVLKEGYDSEPSRRIKELFRSSIIILILLFHSYR